MLSKDSSRGGVGSATPPMWFTLITIGAILCGLAEIYVGYGLLSAPSSLPTFSDAKPDIFDNLGLIARYIFVAAAGVGLIGGVLMILRKKWARAAFIVALGGSLQPIFLSFGHLAIPLVTAALCGAEIWLATVAQQRGWLL